MPTPLTFNWTTGGYAPSLPLAFDFLPGSQSVYGLGFDTSAIGDAGVQNLTTYVAPAGTETAEFGTGLLYSRTADIIVLPNSWDHYGVPGLHLRFTQTIGAPGIDGQGFGEIVPAHLLRFDFLEESDPPPDPLVFAWVNGLAAEGIYSFQSGTAGIQNYRNYLGAYGVYELGFGAHRASLALQYALPTGVDAFSTGLATIGNVSEGITAQSFSPMGMGAPSLVNTSQGIGCYGLDSLEIGAPTVDHYTNYLAPSGIGAPAIPDPFVSNEIRQLQPEGMDAGPVGLGIVYNQTGVVTATGIPSLEMGAPAFGYNRMIFGLGTETLEFGGAAVHDNRQTMPASGVLTESIGLALVRREFDRVEDVTAGDTERWGFTYVANLNQVVVPAWEGDIHLPEPGEPLISNLNRVLRPQAFEALRIVYYHVVTVGLGALAPLGIGAATYGVPLVAHRVRTLLAHGSTTESVGDAIVANAAAAISAPGIDSSVIGAARAWNNRQFVTDVRVGSFLGMGANPFIAQAIRYVSPVTMDVLDAGRALVWNRLAYVSPHGVDGFETSTTDVRDKAKRVHIELPPQPGPFGLGIVANRNRTVGAGGFEGLGLVPPVVDNRNHYVRPPGASFSALGDSDRIEFLVRDLAPVGFAGGYGTATLRNIPEPPATQRLEAFGIDAAGAGAPSVTANSLYATGFTTAAVGSPSVHGTLLQPIGIPSFDYGVPGIIMAQYLDCSDHGIEPSGVGRPQMKPLTIWAPYGAPEQAVVNHGGVNGNVIGYLEYQIGGEKIPFGDRTTWFGDVGIGNRVRYLTPVWTDDGAYGQPGVTQRVPLFVSPVGFNAFRTAFHEVLGGVRSIAPFGSDSSEFGAAGVQLRDRHPETFGISAGGAGEPSVSSRPQALGVRGVATEEFGGLQTPYYAGLWASLEYGPFAIDGFDAGTWGVPMVSNYYRTLAAEGFDAMASEETPPDDRMTVRGRAGVFAQGFDAASAGLPIVGNGTRRVLVSSVFHASLPQPCVQSGLRPAGIDAGTMGGPEIDMTEPGTLKAKGRDTVEFGLALIRMSVAPSGVSAGAQGSASVAHAARPSGIDSLEMGAVVASDDGGHVCGSAPRAVVQHPFDTLTVGEPSVG